MEKLLTDLALKTRAIRDLQAKKDRSRDAGRRRWSLVLLRMASRRGHGAGAAAASAASAGAAARQAMRPNPPYDGRFTFVRLRYGPPTRLRRAAHSVVARLPDRRAALHEDPERAELPEPAHRGNEHPRRSTIPSCSSTRSRTWRSRAIWMVTDEEAVGVPRLPAQGRLRHRRRLPERRGGWGNFEAQMRRVLPEARFVDLDADAPDLPLLLRDRRLDIVPQFYDTGAGRSSAAIFEDNDPTKRLLVMINFNTDISEFWELSDTGLKPIDESNEAYKLGVNYIIYGMTH